MSIRVFKIDCELYHFTFNVCIGNPKEATNYANTSFGLPNEIDSPYQVSELSNYGGAVLSYDDCAPILWIPSIPKTPSELSALSHEIFHIVCKIMKWVNIPLAKSSEEAYCYLIGYITKQFWLEVKK